MIALFTIMMCKYRVFRQSIQFGDAIIVEYLYAYFIPLCWLMTGKQNYVEMGKDQDGQENGSMANGCLHGIKCNLSIRRVCTSHPHLRECKAILPTCPWLQDTRGFQKSNT
jgi:hypothetical protein